MLHALRLRGVLAESVVRKQNGSGAEYIDFSSVYELVPFKDELVQFKAELVSHYASERRPCAILTKIELQVSQ